MTPENSGIVHTIVILSGFSDGVGDYREGFLRSISFERTKISGNPGGGHSARNLSRRPEKSGGRSDL